MKVVAISLALFNAAFQAHGLSATTPQLGLMVIVGGEKTSTIYLLSTENFDSELAVVKKVAANKLYFQASWSAKQQALTYTIDPNGIGIQSSSGLRRFESSLTVDYPNLSPDGEFFLFNNLEYRYEDKDKKRFLGTDYSVVIMDKIGKSSTVFVPENQKFSLSPARWSTDGAFIAFAIRPTLSTSDIYLLSTTCIRRSQDQPKCLPTELKIVDKSGDRHNDEFEASTEPWDWPTWSPDGKQLGFACGGAICVIDRDGTDFRRLGASQGIRLTWSPDGRYLAYQVVGEIGVFDLKTNIEVDITKTPNVIEEAPVWLAFPDASFLYSSGN